MAITRLQHYIHLTRLHKPIGTILVLWPALWGLWLAAGGFPDVDILLIFIAGAFVIRAAGCAINDFADRHFDAHVERTNYRPVATGKIQPWEALLIFVLLCFAGLGLVLMTNRLTLVVACVAVAIIATYPFMKRYTHLPQVVLGMAWASSIPMAFAAQVNSLPAGLWLMVLGVVCWTMVFDTFYAMVDRDDDLKIGIKSTAILFGRYDLLMIGLFQCITLVFFSLGGLYFERGTIYFAGIGVVSGIFIYQQTLGLSRKKPNYFAAFMNNRWVGLSLFVAIVLDYIIST